jgi:HD-GYP domain-containing protein (c-di-GMP phosphodiesterase class II)
MNNKVDEKERHALAFEVINLLSTVLKNLKIYNPNNLLIQNLITNLDKTIHNVLDRDGKAIFLIKPYSMFFNDTKVKFEFATYVLYRSFYENCLKKRIGTISFLKGLREKDIEEFVVFFASHPSTEEISFETFYKELTKKGVQNIVLEKMADTETTLEDVARARKSYFMGITHLKEVFHEEEGEEADMGKISVLISKRLLQNIFDFVSDNESFLFGMTNIKNFDEYTLNHSMNVSILSMMLGKRMGFERQELIDLALSAFFHDYGKLDIPIDILNKPGKLDDDERIVIEKHPHYGAGRIIRFKHFSRLPFQTISVALEHHASSADIGYPKYQKKETIGLFSKIVKIVDFFDAVTTKRPYRKRNFTTHEALSMMFEKSGDEFDPVILKIFANMVGTYPVGTMVLLDSGEIGIVFEAVEDPDDSLRPIVKIIAYEDGNKVDGKMVDLNARNKQTGKYLRTIVKSLNPDKYSVKVADYFVAFNP